MVTAINTYQAPPPLARPRSPWKRTSRRGIEALELIIALPVLLIATIAIFQFGILAVVDQAVVVATTKAAREAGKDPNISMDDLATIVNDVLVVHNIAILSSTMAGGPSMSGNVILEVGGGSTTKLIPGNAGQPPATPSLQTDEVRVTVCVELRNPPIPGETPPVPDALSSFGFTLNGRSLVHSTLVKKE